MAPPASAALQLEMLGLKAKEAAQWRGMQENMSELDSLTSPEMVNALEGSREFHEVWSWNLNEEFDALLGAVAGEAGVLVALDMEFPGFVCAEPRVGPRDVRYQALRENVDSLRPIQLGVAVSSADGVLRGVWTFNLRFDIRTDLHTEQSIAFLRAAGIDFPRHASEGIEAEHLGRRLAGSYLVGQHGRSPSWITFSGAYDLGYLLKLLTGGSPLPQDSTSFDAALRVFCPKRHELKEHLPHGSLESLARQYSIRRHGSAHTAGSDALLTLELFLCLIGVRCRTPAKKWNQWEIDNWSGANSAENWYGGGTWDTWGTQSRWEEQYNALNFSMVNSTTATGSMWNYSSSPLSTAVGNSMAWASSLQQPFAAKATTSSVWSDASIASAMLKSGSWHSTEPTMSATQVLAI